MHESAFENQPPKDDGTQTANPVVHDAETMRLDLDATTTASAANLLITYLLLFVY